MPGIQSQAASFRRVFNSIDVGFSISHSFLGQAPNLLPERNHVGLGHTREFYQLALRLDESQQVEEAPLTVEERVRLEELLVLAENGSLMDEIETLRPILRDARADVRSGRARQMVGTEQILRDAQNRFSEGMREISAEINDLAIEVRTILGHTTSLTPQ